MRTLLCSIFIVFLIAGCIQLSETQDNNETVNQTSTAQGMEENKVEIAYPINFDVPRIYDMVASDNSQDYTGDRIDSEKPSDWKNYKPMVDLVNELVKNKNSDYDRVISIANWIKNSKNYSKTYEDRPRYFATVIYTFDYKSGVCYDSALLTAAILRLAGIPARSVSGQLFVHQWDEAYLRDEQKWVTVDATYKTANYSKDVSILNMSYGTSFVGINEYWTTKYNATGSEYGDVFESIDYYKNKLTYKEGYGTVMIPLTSNLTLTSNIQITGRACKENTSVDIFQAPSLWYIGRNRKTDGQDWTSTIPINGYLKFNLPPCSYRIYFGVSSQLIDDFRELNYFNSSIGSGFDNKIAYIDFDIKNGDTTVLTAQNFGAVEGKNPIMFNILVKEIESIPLYSTLETFR